MNPKTLPLTLVISFHLATFTLFMLDVGVEYPNRNTLTLIAYVLILETALALGFMWGMNKRPYEEPPSRTIASHPGHVSTQLPRLGFFIMLILFIPEIRTYTGAGLGEFAHLLTNPADAYSRMADQVAQGREARVGIIAVTSLLSFLTVSVMPVFGYLYFRYRQYGRTLLVASLLTLIMSVFRGTDKEMFDVGILLGATWLIAKCNKATQSGRDRRVQIVSRRFMIVGTITALGIIAMFSFRKVERMQKAHVACFQNTDLCYYIDPSNPLTMGLGYFVRYMTQGYYGLSVSLDAVPRIAGNGVGHSRPLQYLFDRYLGWPSKPAITDQLTELGWTNTGAWSTGYVSIGDDVTMYGVPVVILLLGLVFGASWSQVLHQPDVASLVLSTYSLYTCVYIIGNLQVAQIGSVYLGLIFWLVVYGNRRVRSAGRLVDHVAQ